MSGVVFVSRPSGDSVIAATTGSAPDAPGAPGALPLGQPEVQEGNASTTMTVGQAAPSTAPSGRATTTSTEESSFEVASQPPETTTTTWDPETPSTTTSRPGPGTPSTTAPPSTTTTTERPGGEPAQPRIVYTRQVQQESPYDMDLFASDLDGGNEEQLTRGPGQDKDPAVSPDGRTIAFIRGRTDDHSTDQVWLMDSDGRNLRMAFAGGPQSMSDPSWSPDGRSLAITAGYNLAALPHYRWRVGISVLDLRTGHLTDVTVGTPRLDRDATPAWSPDGTKIAFARQGAASSDPDDHNIYTVNRDGTGMGNLDPDDHTQRRWYPSWLH